MREKVKNTVLLALEGKFYDFWVPHREFWTSDLALRADPDIERGEYPLCNPPLGVVAQVCCFW